MARAKRNWPTVGCCAVGLLLAVGCGEPDQNAAAPRGDGVQSGQLSITTQPEVGWYEDVTVSAGFRFVHQLADKRLSNIMESDGAGGTILDYDGDGFMDVYLVNSGPAPGISDAPAGTERTPNALLRNRSDGTFEDVTDAAGVAGYGFGTTAAAADYDNDGHTDLYVVNFGGGILYRNRGDGTFEDVTAPAGLKAGAAGISAAFLDVDLDGFLDLFVANYLKFDPSIEAPSGGDQPYPGPLAYDPEFNLLFRNRGDGTFEDVSAASGIRLPGHRAMSVSAVDYDLDGDQDLYVSNDGTANLLLRNDGQGRFEDVALQLGVALNQFGEPEGSMGASVGDANGDSRPDLLVTSFGKASFYVNSEAGFFEDRIVASGILGLAAEYVGWGGNFLDFDNDGDLDLFIANGDPHFLVGLPPLLLENRGDAVFTSASERGGPFFATRPNARGSGAFDYDNDGRVDLVLTTLGGKASLLRNRGQGNPFWLCLEFEGTESNRDGLGALVKVSAGGRAFYGEARCSTCYVFQQDPRLHFGLGAQDRADRIEIRWPSGRTQSLSDIAANQILRVREPGASRWE